MIIAHLPAGYVLTRVLQKHNHTRRFLFLGLVASILPDFDLTYYYFLDTAPTSHRLYYTHLPMLWLAIMILVAPIVLWLKNPSIKLALTIFFSNIFMHLCLDTVPAKVYWLRPFIDEGYQLMTIPLQYQGHWVLNYMLSTVFIIEIVICICAACFWLLDFFARKKSAINGMI